MKAHTATHTAPHTDTHSATHTATHTGGTSKAMPWLAVCYMAANITLNLSAIALVKRGV